jgi:hypothetical protein
MRLVRRNDHEAVSATKENEEQDRKILRKRWYWHFGSS